MIKISILMTLYFITFSYLQCKEIIIADISDNKIDIDVGFKGAKLLFFGVIDDEGDIVVSVTGPRKAVKVRKKEKKFGVWLNKDSKVFYDVPTYYYVATSKPLEELNANQALLINQVGIENIRFEGAEEKIKEERDLWKSGIINSMINSGRYFAEEGNIKISYKRLFKTELNFSAELIDGEYLVSSLLIKNGNVVAARRSYINVSKSGYGEKIYKMAMNNSFSYGLISVFISMLFGFAVHETIRRANA